MKYFKKLVGDRIYLSPRNSEDIEIFTKWLNDFQKVEWKAALERENYLKSAEMSTEDDYGMIDGIINNGPKEDKSAERSGPPSYSRSADCHASGR